MIKKIYNTLLAINILNIIYIIIRFIIMFTRFITNNKYPLIEDINYVRINWILIVLLIELIYLVLNLKKQINKRKIIVLLLLFIIQTVIMCHIPIYTEDVGGTCKMPAEWNIYGF